MMEKKYLCDISLATELIEDFTKNINYFQDYCNDLKTQSAVERQLLLIGEALNKVKKVNQEFSIENDTKIIGFRNRLVHAYDNIDNSIVWVIIQRHLEPLKKEINTLIQENTP